jgi:hypothetical protein
MVGAQETMIERAEDSSGHPVPLLSLKQGNERAIPTAITRLRGIRN